MSQKPKRTFAIVIRRLIAGFLLFSILWGLIEDIAEGDFSQATIDVLLLD